MVPSPASFWVTDDGRLQSPPGRLQRRVRLHAGLRAVAIQADFPLEHARLLHIPWITAVLVGSLALYSIAMNAEWLSWQLAARPGWVAVPLLLQLMIVAGSNGTITINQTLISDLCPGQCAGSTAISTLVSQLLNAAGVSFVKPLLEAWGLASSLSLAKAFTTDLEKN